MNIPKGKSTSQHTMSEGDQIIIEELAVIALEYIATFQEASHRLDLTEATLNTVNDTLCRKLGYLVAEDYEEGL
jgi:hypothetical protein